MHWAKRFIQPDPISVSLTSSNKECSAPLDHHHHHHHFRGSRDVSSLQGYVDLHPGQHYCHYTFEPHPLVGRGALRVTYMSCPRRTQCNDSNQAGPHVPEPSTLTIMPVSLHLLLLLHLLLTIIFVLHL